MALQKFGCDYQLVCVSRRIQIIDWFGILSNTDYDTSEWDREVWW